MKKMIVVVSLFMATAGVAYASDLLAEFNRREAIRLTQEQGNAINFLKTLNFDVSKIEELQVLTEAGYFILRDRDDVICVGLPSSAMLRCKNKAGISTVLYEGDND